VEFSDRSSRAPDGQRLCFFDILRAKCSYFQKQYAAMQICKMVVNDSLPGIFSSVQILPWPMNKFNHKS